MIDEAQAAISHLFGWKGNEMKKFVEENGEEEADKRAKEELNKLTAK